MASMHDHTMYEAHVIPLLPLYTRYYAQQSAFYRLLSLLANEIVAKTRDIIGDDLLKDPLEVCRL